jgi:transposase
MNFREATENLCAGLSHEDLAKALGVSIATVRQARLRPDAKAHRSPPEDWESAVIRLAEERLFRYRELIERLRAAKVSREARHAISSVSSKRRHTA